MIPAYYVFVDDFLTALDRVHWFGIHVDDGNIPLTIDGKWFLLGTGEGADHVVVEKPILDLDGPFLWTVPPETMAQQTIAQNVEVRFKEPSLVQIETNWRGVWWWWNDSTTLLKRDLIADAGGYLDGPVTVQTRLEGAPGWEIGEITLHLPL